MQRIVLLIALCSSFVLNATAQNLPSWIWGRADTATKFFGTPGYPHHVVAAANNKLFWGVQVNPQLGLNPASYGDYRVSEYDTMGYATGNNYMLNGQVYFKDAQADAAGNWYLLGTYYDTIKYTNNAVTIAKSYSQPAHVILRLDAGTLNMSWYQHLGVTYYSSSNCFCIKGNYLYIPIDSSLIATVYKIDLTNGSRTALLSQKAGRVTSIAVDSNENIYIAGNCAQVGDSADFNGHKIFMTAAYSAYVARYHANRQYDWTVWMNDITCTNRQLTLANNNSIYYAGGLNDSLTISGHFVKKPRIIGSNFIAASLDSLGAVNWVRTANDSAGTASMDYIYNSVVVDTTFVVMPSARNYIDWGSNINTNFSTRTLPVLIGYNKTGKTSWMRFTDASFSVAHHIVTDGRSVWVTGNHRDTFGMALDTVIVTPTIWPAYSPYMAKLKIADYAIDTTDTTNTVVIIPRAEPRIAPNPATHVVQIAGLTESTDIKMVSVTGNVVYVRNALKPAAQEYIDVSSYPRGLYFIEFRTATSRTVKKVVLN